MKKNKNNNKKRSRKVLSKAQRRRDRRERQKRWNVTEAVDRDSPRDHHNVLDLQGYRTERENLQKLDVAYNARIQEYTDSIKGLSDDEFYDESTWKTYWVTGVVAAKGPYAKLGNLKCVYKFPVRAPTLPAERNDEIRVAVNAIAFGGLSAIIREVGAGSVQDVADIDSYFVDTEEDAERRWELIRTIPAKKYSKYLTHSVKTESKARSEWSGDGHPSGISQHVVVVDGNANKMESLGRWRSLFHSQGGMSSEDLGVFAANKHIGNFIPVSVDIGDAKVFLQEFTGSKVKKVARVLFDATELLKDKERWMYG